MKISYHWLKDFIKIEESPEQIANILTATGLEVEGIEKYEPIKGGLEGLVIGEVMECSQHPNADKLSLTKVDIGEAELASIVCGAPNVATGQKVIVATVGCTLYPSSGEPFKIKKSKIRGEASEGMICAEDEIGLGSSHAGIMVLDTNLPNGTPAVQYFDLPNDVVLEIGLTPNRADAASHLGVSRDLKAVLGREICLPAIPNLPKAASQSKVEVLVEDTEGSIRYSGISISGVKVTESPEWLKHRLQAIDLEPINNIVDITNYVLHELGQPLHAFDQSKITTGKVVVKTLAANTPFVTLDKKQRKLGAGDLMICNGDEPMCIAGVFGGINSGVTESTTEIFLESACFHPGRIRSTANHHGLKTDASFRFERGTDPEITLKAMWRAASLICEIAGGKIASDVIDIYPNPVAKPVIEVSYKNIDRLIGKVLPREEIKRILVALDFELSKESDLGFTVLAPTYRVDVTREADVIEEILRIYGLDNIELAPKNQTEYLAEFPKVDSSRLQQDISNILAGMGYSEIMTNSLTKPDYSQKIDGFDPNENVEILNKLSEELGVMRQHLAFTGMDVLAHNLNHRQWNLKLYEFGKTYKKLSDGSYHEQEKLVIYLVGNKSEENWIEKERRAAFHDLYQVVSNILVKLNQRDLQTTPTKNPMYAYALDLANKGGSLALLGQLHPKVGKLAGIKEEVFMADIDWQELLSQFNENTKLQEVSKFPEVRRDLSLVVDKKVSFSDIQQIVSRKEFWLVKKVNVFDVYEGDKIESGKKAYALSFILQDSQRTLNEKDIDKTMARLIKLFENDLFALIRK